MKIVRLFSLKFLLTSGEVLDDKQCTFKAYLCIKEIMTFPPPAPNFCDNSSWRVFNSDKEWNVNTGKSKDNGPTYRFRRQDTWRALSIAIGYYQ